MATNNQQMTEEELRRLAQSLSRFGESIDVARQKTGPFADALNEAAQEQKEAFDKVKKGLKDFSSNLNTAGFNFMTTFLSSEQGTGKFGDAVQGATDAAADLAKGIPFVGGMLGGLISAGGKLIAASLKQNDALMKAYRDFADVGNVAGSIEKVIGDLHSLGLTSFQAENFAKILKDTAPQLANFGGSVSEGSTKFVQVFSGMIGIGNQTEQMLGRLGYSTQDMREATADYIQKQTRLGLAQGKSVDQLRLESVRYMGTLAELREITGMSRDEAQKTMDEQMKQARFAMTLKQIEATDGKEAADRAAAGMAAFENKFGSDAATGLMEQIANKGAIVGEASARIDRATLGQAYKNFTDLTYGRINTEKMLGNTSAAVEQNMKALGPAFMIAGDSIKDMTGDNALIVGSMANVNTKQGNAHERLNNLMKISGDRLSQNIEIEQTMRAARIAGDNALKMIGDKVVEMFNKLLKIMFKFAKFMAEMIDKFTASSFGKYLGLDPTNLSEFFRDEDDVAEDLKKAKREQKGLGKDETYARQEFRATVDPKYDQIAFYKERDDLNKKIKKATEMSENSQLSEYDRNLALAERNYLKQRLEMWELDRKKAIAQDGLGEEILDLDKLRKGRLVRLQAIEKEALKNKNEINELEAEKKSYLIEEITKLKNGGGINPMGGPSQISTGVSAWNTDKTGQSASPDVMLKRQTAQQDNLQQGIGRSEEILSKLNFGGKSKERKGGGSVDPALLGLAEKIAKEFPGATFTALNDLYHQKNNPNSKHTTGKALDFVLATPPKNADEAAVIRDQLKNLGATKVLDEYFSDKNANTTGGHFHLEVAKMGGLFKGSESGYPVELHGKNESAWPEQKLQNLLKDVEKSSIEKYKQELMDKMDLSDYNKPTQSSNIASGDTRQMEDMISRMIDKFDTLISLQDKSNNISDELLTYTRA